MLGFLFDYIRMAAYSIIILASLNGIAKRKFNNILFIGDIAMALGLLLANMHINVLGKDYFQFADLLLTPAAVVWAVVHLYNMLKREE